MLPLLLTLLTTAGGDLPRRPNVVLFLVDDAGVECFGPYGGEYPTPNIDRLAAEGVRFDNAHSQPLCTPTRVKIMTGQSNLRNYVRFSVMDPDEWTFGHMLQAAGYHTGIVGKWQLLASEQYGPRVTGTGLHPRDAGFHEYLLWQVERLGSRYWAPLLLDDGELVQAADQAYGPDLLSRWAVDFIARNKDEPFFLYYPMVLVHDPFVPPPNARGRRSAKTTTRKSFASMIAYTDEVVGRVVGALDEHGLREDTLVIFTSDNGTHSEITSIRNGTPVRGGKGTTRDSATHVPLIARWSGVAPAGTACPDLIDFADFVPTLAELAGAELSPERPCDGRSFLPQVRGEPGSPRDALFCYCNPRPDEQPGRERRFARTVRHKLYSNGELYDVLADPREKSPLAPEEATEVRTQLQEVLESMPAQPAKLRTAEGE